MQRQRNEEGACKEGERQKGEVNKKENKEYVLKGRISISKDIQIRKESEHKEGDRQKEQYSTVQYETYECIQNVSKDGLRKKLYTKKK